MLMPINLHASDRNSLQFHDLRVMCFWFIVLCGGINELCVSARVLDGFTVAGECINSIVAYTACVF